MRIRMAFLITILLLFLAALPWIIAACAPDPMMPESLLVERSRYDTVVVTAQAATIEAQRAEPSKRKVVPVGTVLVSPVAASPALTPTATVLAIEIITTPEPPTPTENESTPVATQVIQLSDQTTKDSSSTVTVTGRTVLTASESISQTETLTSVVIVVQSDSPATTTPTKVNETPGAASIEAENAPPIPAGLVDLKDVITTHMLVDQVALDSANVPLSDLIIDITDRGFTASARLGLIPGFSKPVIVTGELAVKNNSLVAQVDSITYGDSDVTGQFRGQVEDGINSSLYRLLPQRYVTSYEIDFGQLVVHSKGNPE